MRLPSLMRGKWWDEQVWGEDKYLNVRLQMSSGLNSGLTMSVWKQSAHGWYLKPGN